MFRAHIIASCCSPRAGPAGLALLALLAGCARANPKYREGRPPADAGAGEAVAGRGDGAADVTAPEAGAPADAPAAEARPDDAPAAEIPPPDAAAPIRTGLVLRWRFDEASGSRATDDSGGGLHGTYVGSVLPAPADGATPVEFSNPHSRQFTASLAQGVQLTATPAALRPTTGITVSIWFRTTITGRADLVAHGTDYFIRYMTGELEFVRRRPAGSSTQWVTATGSAPGANDGRWHHAAGVATLNSTTMYLDGREIDRDSSALPFTYTGNSLDVGRSAAGSLHFDGWLDDLRIYNRALTDIDIRALAAGAP